MSETIATPPRSETPPPRRANSGTVESVIGEDTSFLGGKIMSKGTLRIDGRIEGEILAEDAVVVGQTGTVKGNITARSIAVSGKVFGNVSAQERLEIQPTGEIHGDFQTALGALIIEGGAKIEGRCLMGVRDKSPEPAMAVRQPNERRVPVEAPPRESNPRPESAIARKPLAGQEEL